MTARIQIQTEPFGEFSDLDIEQLAIENPRLSISYEHPARFTFSVNAVQQTRPIEYHTFIRFWISGETVRGAAQSSSNPLFEGFVESIQPVASNRIEYECFDPTYRAAKEVRLFDAPYLVGNPETGEWPQPGTGAIPRLVYNAKNDADDDYAYCVGYDGTIANIIAGILEYCYHPMVWRNAAPGDGTAEGAALPYVSGDLSSFDFKPQEKLVFQSEGVRSCVDRIRRYEPRMRLLWEPGSRLWRFAKIDSSPEVTLRLNDPAVDFPILSMDLQSSIENCHTAVRIYGPPATELAQFTWYAPLDDEELDPPVSTLTPVGDPVILQTYTNASGVFNAQTWQRWQIIDTTRRRGARLLPDWVAASVYNGRAISVRTPILQCSWDRGTTWATAQNVWFNYATGTAEFVGTAPYHVWANDRGQSIIDGTSQTVFPPTAVRIIWAPFIAPLQVRIPEEGYEGTAFTVTGLVRELEQYDESLATGREWGQPVTTAARMEQFRKYARAQLDERKDIVWTGGLVLDGLDFSFASLNKRVSFTSNDGAGGDLEIGWEDIKAIVSDVEFDFAQRTTSITFSSDWMELLGLDPSEMKARLQIKALEQVTLFAGQTLTFGLFKNYKGYQVRQLTGVMNNYRIAYLDELGAEQ